MRANNLLLIIMMLISSAGSPPDCSLEATWPKGQSVGRLAFACDDDARLDALALWSAAECCS